MIEISARRIIEGENKICSWCKEPFQRNDFVVNVGIYLVHKACGYTLIERIHQALTVRI